MKKILSPMSQWRNDDEKEEEKNQIKLNQIKWQEKNMEWIELHSIEMIRIIQQKFSYKLSHL